MYKSYIILDKIHVNSNVYKPSKHRDIMEQLNENDLKLISFCENKSRTITDISKVLDISLKNVWTRIAKLKKLNLIKTEKIGKSNYIRSIAGDQYKKFLYELLLRLQEKDGTISPNDYLKLLDYDIYRPEDTNMEDKIRALWGARFQGFVTDKTFITDKGRDFLKQNNPFKTQI